MGNMNFIRESASSRFLKQAVNGKGHFVCDSSLPRGERLTLLRPRRLFLHKMLYYRCTFFIWKKT